jgi:transposase-like protein
LSQHFLLSAKAVTLSVVELARMSEDEAYEAVKAIRFEENGGEPFCPRCGVDAIYTYKARRLFKCKGCEKQFTVTSGTTFRSRKMSYGDILVAILSFSNGVNGNAALRLRRDLRCSYKTAFVLSQKLRRSMADMQRDRPLTGDVDADGIYIGGHIRPANLLADRRTDGRKEFNGKRRSIVTVRERRSGGRSRAFVVPNEAAAKPSIFAVTHPNAHITTDDSAAFGRFNRHFREHSVVNHSVGMMVNGIHTNLVEAQHTRIRRAERGVYLGISGAHAQRVADELSWRDDMRRVDNGQQFRMIATRALKLGPDQEMRGYWQKRPSWYLRQKRREALKALTKRRRGLAAKPISYTARATS